MLKRYSWAAAVSSGAQGTYRKISGATPPPGNLPNNQFVEFGGLMSYTEDRAYMFRRAAEYVDKILTGTKPADLPVERPKKFEFIVNLKTAKQIGLIIPPNVLARADRVIK